MKVQVGDKVKFLNSSGGGIVSKIISPTLVNVMIEDGFEIPTMTSELIKVDPKGKVERMFDEEFPVASSQFAVRSSQSAIHGGGENSKDKSREPGTANRELIQFLSAQHSKKVLNLQHATRVSWPSG